MLNWFVPTWKTYRWSEREGKYVEARDPNPMSLEKSEGTLNLLLIAAIGGMALYLINKAKNLGKKATDAISTGIADAVMFWNNLAYGGPIQVLGNVALPDGSVAAISSLTWKSDNQGNAYTNISGSVYELAARDGNGNFTLSQVA